MKLKNGNNLCATMNYLHQQTNVNQKNGKQTIFPIKNENNETTNTVYTRTCTAR